VQVKNAAAKQQELEQQLVTVEESLKIKTDAVSAFAAEKKAAVQAVSIIMHRTVFPFSLQLAHGCRTREQRAAVKYGQYQWRWQLCVLTRACVCYA